MRTTRLLGLTALAATAVLVAFDATPAADPVKTKQQLRQELRKRLREQGLAAPAKPAETPTVAPKPAVVSKPAAGATDATALARFIDEQIDAKLAAEGVAPAPVCSDAEFLRRAYLDITGVIPPADKARQFLDDADPGKRAKLIDALLADPNYGRHQADRWVPKLFPKDSGNRFVQKEPFAEWVAAEFNKNTPWDKFVTSVVTASGPVDENPAVTYYLANRTIDKLTDTVTQHFLGIQLQCAQCHNHPFTGWKQTEYWGMAAFFSHVQADRPKNPNMGGDNGKIGVREGLAKSRVKDFFPESAKTVPAKFLGGPEPRLAETAPHRPALAKWLTAPENPYFAKAMANRTWAQFFGAGLVNPIDDMHEDNTPSHPDLLAGLATAFADGGFDVKHLTRAICSSRAYQRSSKPAGPAKGDKAPLFAHQAVKVMTPEQLFDSLTSLAPAEKAGGKGDKVKGAAVKGQPGSPRDRFVQFFLGGADQPAPTEYDAGIPQALKLMNGRLGAITGQGFARAAGPPARAVETIYLTALSRRPTSAEVARLTAYVANAPTPAEGYGDVLWAVLNSSEFTMIR